MNSKRIQLALGWVFLMLMTAGGVFYAADELDQRGSLAKYALHEKFGYAGASIASVPYTAPPSTAQNQPPQPPPPQNLPPSQQTQLPPQQYQPPQQQSPPAQQQQYPPAQQNQYPPVQQNQYPPAQQQYPPPINQNRQHNLQLTQQQRYQQQIYQQQQALILRQQQALLQQQRQNNHLPNQQQYRQRPMQQSAPLTGVSPALRDRLTDAASRSEATAAQWRPILESLKSMGQSPRPQILAALNGMRQYMQQAQGLARLGDIAGANHALDMAAKQMDILDKARE